MPARLIATAASRARCLPSLSQGARRISTQKADIPPASGTAKLTNRRLISLHGPDTPKFLQGIITNNVQADTASSGYFAAFLTAQGKVLNDVFIYPTSGSRWQQEKHDDGDPGYLVEVDAAQAERLLKHLKRHKLRSKFKLQLLDQEELAVWSGWREDERWTQHTKATSDDGLLSLQDGRAPGMGSRILLPADAQPSSVAQFEDTEQASLEAYTIRRYLKGIAEGQEEIPSEESLPMNYNFDIMGGIDFKKGCYIGQELTIRTHHTGVVRRRVLPVSLYDASQEPPQQHLYSSDVATPAAGIDIKKEGGKRATGKLIKSIGNVGIAMCRLEQMSDLTISVEGSAFSPADRFVIEDAETGRMGVKPFVPDWIRGRIREPRVQRRVE